jgi:hypothetical protein
LDGDAVGTRRLKEFGEAAGGRCIWGG